jgi:hypothetical protein
MARKRYKPEEIVAKLRQVDVLVSRGRNPPVLSEPGLIRSPTLNLFMISPPPRMWRHGRPFHRRFLLQVLKIAVDRTNCQHLVAASIAHQAIGSVDVTIDLELVPFFGMSRCN